MFTFYIFTYILYTHLLSKIHIMYAIHSDVERVIYFLPRYPIAFLPGLSSSKYQTLTQKKGARCLACTECGEYLS